MTAKPISLAILGGLLAVSACAGGVDLAPTEAKSPTGQTPRPAFAQFTDIPVPPEVTMDIERSLVFGGPEDWIGRLVLTSSRNTGEVFDFYKHTARQLGWQEITLIRSGTSVLTFGRGERVMTVQIAGRTLRGSEVSLTVSPRGKQVMDASLSADAVPRARK